ncbi:MAG: cupin domain-containing protein [Gammaproteobacteria bacterium]|nr:cupin domain-containing protein [Gammaproteobacteria bacterium]
MTDSDEFQGLVRASDIAANESTFCHPWNEKSEITGTRMSEHGGLSRTGVSRVRIQPGKESFAYHTHHFEEEWIYILSGRGMAKIDGKEYEMGSGDFVAFPTPSVAHLMSNPFDEELVYLMGGEALDHEVADFPELDKRMVRTGEQMDIYNLSDTKPFFEPGEPGNQVRMQDIDRDKGGRLVRR